MIADFQEQLRSQISSALRQGHINHEAIASMTSELMRIRGDLEFQTPSRDGHCAVEVRQEEQKCMRSPQPLTDTFQQNPLDSNLQSIKFNTDEQDRRRSLAPEES